MLSPKSSLQLPEIGLVDAWDLKLLQLSTHSAMCTVNKRHLVAVVTRVKLLKATLRARQTVRAKFCTVSGCSTTEVSEPD